MKRIAVSVLSAIILTGCITAPVPSGTFQHNLDARATARIIYDTAQNCWNKKATLTANGITVSNRIELDGIVITAWYMQYPDINPFPVAIITVSDSPGGSSIRVSEARMGNDLTSDIARWLKGDSTCHKLNY